MSKRTYEEMCQRKNEIQQLREETEKCEFDRRAVIEGKIEDDDQVWLKNISKKDSLLISQTLWNETYSLNDLINLAGSTKDFKRQLQTHMPDFYQQTRQAKPRRQTHNMIYILKLYYLHLHPVFYMSNNIKSFYNSCFLEFKLIPESWWSQTFEAVLINFTTQKASEEKLLEPLLNTKFIFKRSRLQDWHIHDFGEYCGRKVRSTKEWMIPKVQTLIQTIGIRGIEWDFFWADLCDHVKPCNYTKCKWEILNESGQLTFQECEPFKPRGEKETPPWIYHYYLNSLTGENTLIIPHHSRPKDVNGIHKIAYYLFDANRSERSTVAALKRHKDAMVTENMNQRMEYLEGCDSLQRHPDFLKPLGQHKEYMLTEILSFLI